MSPWSRRLLRRARPLLRRARPAIRRVGDGAPASAIATLLERLRGSSPHRLPVLMYHRIADPRESRGFWPGLISATPAEFSNHIAVLSERYRFIGLDELLQIRRGERRPASDSLHLTFDEGYRDFEEHAWPVLRRHGLPATVFVATAFPDTAQPFWWDELSYALVTTTRRAPVATTAGTFFVRTSRQRTATLRRVHALMARLPHRQATALIGELVTQLDVPPLEGDVLGWGSLRALVNDGLTIAAHTHTHPRLTNVDPSSLDDELRTCQNVLQRELGRSPPALAYPAGDHNPSVIAAAARAGFEIGFSTRRGVNDLRQVNWMRLDRINVGTASAVPLIRAQLATLPPSVSD